MWLILIKENWKKLVHYHTTKKDTKEGVFSVGGDGGMHLHFVTMAKPNRWVQINPPLPTQQKRVG